MGGGQSAGAQRERPGGRSGAFTGRCINQCRITKIARRARFSG